MAFILVVEDEPTILMLAESVLAHAGYETLTASTLAEAEAIIQSDRTIDLVFTDITLNDEPDGGLRVGELTRQTRKGTPVIYASGRPLTDGMKSMLVEASSFLPKPYTDEQVLLSISSQLQASRN